MIFENVSKFYGDVLGVNRVNLSIPPGITGLVGPNGSGKTTLMNMMVGLIRPSRGRISVLGMTPDQPRGALPPRRLRRAVRRLPAGLTGYQFVESYLRVHGFAPSRPRRWPGRRSSGWVWSRPRKRKVAGYSKGMRQRIRLAQALAHEPSVMVLDEPLNGLDPMARAEVIDLFRELADGGLHVIVSSHILHEVDLISDQVVLINGGYIVAEGDIGDVRDEMEEEHPVQVLVRCDRPSLLASRVFEQDHVVEARIARGRPGAAGAHPRRRQLPPACSTRSCWPTASPSRRWRRPTPTSTRSIST